jgi:hypothetical protein
MWAEDVGGDPFAADKVHYVSVGTAGGNVFYTFAAPKKGKK